MSIAWQESGGGGDAAVTENEWNETSISQILWGLFHGWEGKSHVSSATNKTVAENCAGHAVTFSKEKFERAPNCI